MKSTALSCMDAEVMTLYSNAYRPSALFLASSLQWRSSECIIRHLAALGSLITMYVRRHRAYIVLYIITSLYSRIPFSRQCLTTRTTTTTSYTHVGRRCATNSWSALISELYMLKGHRSLTVRACTRTLLQPLTFASIPMIQPPGRAAAPSYMPVISISQQEHDHKKTRKKGRCGVSTEPLSLCDAVARKLILLNSIHSQELLICMTGQWNFSALYCTRSFEAQSERQWCTRSE